ncbi:MAG: Coenzyme F420 hydrogenase/dehydrogenase, beta subunit C-terminal domain, partial [Promethearchaeota archaeon]
KLFVQGELGIPLSTVKKFDVSKGQFYVYKKDGTVKQVSIGKTKQFTWSSCHFCKDFSAELADISVGSAGTFSNDWNSVILRTDIGVKIFNGSIDANKIIATNNVDHRKIEKNAFRKKTKITKPNEKTIDSMQLLGVSDSEIRTYTTLMSLGQASESILTEVMKSDKNLVISALKSLIQREWITSANGSFSVINPKIVISNEIYKQRTSLMERIEKLNNDVLPNLETIYVQNNISQLRHREDLDFT